MKAQNTNRNSGQFSSWHMERKAENKYSDGDQTKRPAAGESSKYIVTDGRPAGTQVKENAWHDGGSGNRGARASELAKYNGSSFEKQSANDAPFMKGDRARNADGQLRSVRGDQLVKNNPSISARAPEIVAKFGNITVAQLETKFGGTSISAIAKMTKGERAAAIQTAPKGDNNQQGVNTQQGGSLTAQLAGIMAQQS